MNCYESWVEFFLFDVIVPKLLFELFKDDFLFPKFFWYVDE